MGEEEKVYLDEAGLTRVFRKIKSDIVDRTIIQVPTLDYVYTYDGTQKETITNQPNLVLSGDYQKTNAGVYTYSVALKDSRTMIWSDGTNAEKYGTLTINKASNCIQLSETEFVEKLWDGCIEKTANVVRKSTGNITATISDNVLGSVSIDDSVVTYEPNENISEAYTGTITISDAGDSNWLPSSYTINLTIYKTPNIVTWASGTVEELTDMLNADAKGLIDIKDYWNDGDTRLVAMNATQAAYNQPALPEQTIAFVLKNDNTKTLSSSLEDGRNTSKFRVEMRNCFTSPMMMLKCSGGTGSTSTTLIYALIPEWINNTFKNALPSGFLDMLKTFNTTVPNITAYFIRNNSRANDASIEANLGNAAYNNAKMSIISENEGNGIRKNGENGEYIQYALNAVTRTKGSLIWNTYGYNFDVKVTKENGESGSVRIITDSYFYNTFSYSNYFALYGVI